MECRPKWILAISRPTQCHYSHGQRHFVFTNGKNIMELDTGNQTSLLAVELELQKPPHCSLSNIETLSNRRK